MGRKQYSNEQKAAVMAALLAGQSISSVAKEYKIPKSTIANWSADSNKTIQGTVPNPKKEIIGELVLVYLEKSLRALIAQAEVFAEKDYLRKQDASELAVLHGVGVDKVFRIAEALAPKEGDSAREAA